MVDFPTVQEFTGQGEHGLVTKYVTGYNFWRLQSLGDVEFNFGGRNSSIDSSKLHFTL